MAYFQAIISWGIYSSASIFMIKQHSVGDVNKIIPMVPSKKNLAPI